ncbi:efflux RND transporter permease subunit [Aequorivita lipolytica]|uniref:Efflux RND transporter permease subunit n=1 Tax=Aequorivita lipolytica TaxID=153267 RepID=A0A5C6YTE4_9FLAO|nr:efflux RND transporter permease subunit [Aequorivita lipolytica]TXD70730.1 efflux RND transporter permease subunit [Aequorivita lipolytica]SRX49770.1 Cation efflux system protein CusA [Aequorivita lipolytica]
MLNKSIKFLIENKLVAVLMLIVFVGFGTVYAPFNWNTGILPSDPVAVDAIPDIGENQQIVFTKWDGRSPQDIEDQITYPLTTSLLGIPGVKTIRSSSMFGFSSIYIIFEEDIEFYWSRSRILEKLNSLPSGLLPEGVNPALGPDATGLGQIFWYTLEGRDKDGNVTGGWDLQELRSIQDYYVKYALASASGVSEVASIGGYVKEYQIDVNPELMRQYNISLGAVVKAVKESNKDIGAQTLEINQAEYLVRGLGYVKSVADIENAVVTSENYTSITIKDIANVSLGPAARRGILDKEGAEVVGAVVVARYGANPMEVINNVKEKIKELSTGLPSKILSDGRTSQLTIVPFYDRTELIQETLGTLNEALTLEILITILVIIVMVFNLKASILISGLLPVAVLMVFIAMKFFGVDANIVALSGIAIAIGTMVDVGIILSENIIRHIDEENEKLETRNSKLEAGSQKLEVRSQKLEESESSLQLPTSNFQRLPINKIVYNASAEVSGAIVTAVATTIISFIPVFTMIGAEGKLFRPLAFTKTFALTASIIIALFLIPPFAAFLFKSRNIRKSTNYGIGGLLLVAGFVAVIFGHWIGLILIGFSFLAFAKLRGKWSKERSSKYSIYLSVAAIVFLLAEYWRPLGVDKNVFWNLIFVSIICFGLLASFSLFKNYYSRILKWALANRLLFLTIPTTLLILGFIIYKNTGKEFMPSLNEGSFLLMPTSMPHAGVEENKRVLQQLDMAVASIPEIETVVGKSGRTESALDPAPLSMYENMIQYKSEYMLNDKGERQRYKVNDDGFFIRKDSSLVANPNTDVSSSAVENYRKNGQKVSITVNESPNKLIADDDGEFFRNWRPEINSPDDIWNEIIRVTKLPGVTSAPKLQPIETRLVMLQTGMRAPMGIKVKGQDLKQIEAFGLELENILKQAEGVKQEAVFADRIVGKPYLLIDINRENLARYGVTVEEVQNVLQVAVGGMSLTQTVEGRERYGVRIRYPRELRADPSDLKKIYVPVEKGSPVPLSELASIRYEQGPQVIKSEDTFLVGYVLFDKLDGFAEVNVVETAQALIQQKIDNGELTVPKGISYKFTGTYENQLRAEKTLSVIVPLALLVIFLILYFQFRSVSTTFMVFTGIAVAFAGGFVMIWFYGQDWFLNFSFFGENLRDLFNIKTINLSVAVWVGFIALFGIATDDGVVMATYLKQTFDKNDPTDIQEIRKSTLEAASKRIRPCLMTTVTTILALLPVLTSTGKGSDIMIPMSIPIFGGMLLDTTSYFLVPVLYSWKKERAAKKKMKLEAGN